MVGCYAAMPEEEKKLLHEWERLYVDGSGKYGTSDWPGWEKYIGKLKEHQPPQNDPFGYVYLLQSGRNKYKIGTTKTINNRIATLQTGNPEKLVLVHHFASNEAARHEKLLHEKYKEKLVRNEWFELSTEEVQEFCNIQSGIEII